MSQLGTQENPHTAAPADWLESGFGNAPYGSVFCKCSKCEIVARCTFSFDFYAGKGGDPLTCERCIFHNWRSPSDVHAFQATCKAMDIYETTPPENHSQEKA